MDCDQRVFVDSGVSWTVYEHAPDRANDHRHLLFVSESEVRRLAVYPTNWRTVDEEALIWLAGVAVLVRRLRRRTAAGWRVE
jgi:acyl-coenzyme A synthetase/AMP-(fatty) acid ligase